jgi:hypothetical protein
VTEVVEIQVLHVGSRPGALEGLFDAFGRRADDPAIRGSDTRSQLPKQFVGARRKRHVSPFQPVTPLAVDLAVLDPDF